MTLPQKALLTEDDLKAWLGYESSSALEQRLREAGIRYKRIGKGGTIATTLDAVNKAFAGNDDFGDIQFGSDRG